MNYCYNACYFAYKHIFWCSRTVQKLIGYEKIEKQSAVKISDIPWLWVGAELEDNTMVTVTDTINININYGDVITGDVIANVTNIQNVKRWLYLDNKTLNEQEFPTDGITIRK